MLSFLQGDLQRKFETFGQLTIERRVLITPKSTIPIANIAVISTGTVDIPRPLAWNLALMLLAVGLVVLVAGFNMKGNLTMALGGVGMVGGLMVALFFARAETLCLSIRSNDGHVSAFTGQRRTLEEVRRLLTDKINSGDESAVYRVSFEKGAIQPMSVGHVEAVGPMPAPQSGQVAASASNGRADPSLDPYMHTAHAPGPQLANGHYAAGNAAHVDYSQVLPQIVDMQRFYAQRQDTLDIAERLNELEFLMRSGTSTAGSRSRLSQLVAELSSILGAYPAVVQIFQQAARLAGV